MVNSPARFKIDKSRIGQSSEVQRPSFLNNDGTMVVPPKFQQAVSSTVIKNQEDGKLLLNDTQQGIRNGSEENLNTPDGAKRTPDAIDVNDIKPQIQKTEKRASRQNSKYDKKDVFQAKDGVQRAYTSRRSQKFNDEDSGDDNGQASNEITYKDTKGNVTKIKPNPRFAKYSPIFMNLLKQNNIITKHPLVSMIISYDSQRAINITQEDDQNYFINQFSIQTTEQTFEEKIGGREDCYIKCKEVVQNSTGQQFATCYIDDGKFRVRIFGKQKRTQQQIESEEILINEMLGLDDYTMVIDAFPDPFITCIFVKDTMLFVDFFHSYSLTHYHFMWDIENRRIVGKPQFDEQGNQQQDQPITMVMDTFSKNFPYKCFYSEERDEIFSVYRQGEIFTIKPDKLEEYAFQKVIDKDLGQMEMLFDQAIVARSSNKVLFFKQEYNEDEEKNLWVLYNSINIRGNIYFIRGNVRIQITTDDLIYFYLIDPETYEPELENVMYNYMCCNQMMIGSKKRYSITYKQNEMSFDIYQRKYMHNLRICVDKTVFEGSKAIEIVSSNLILLSNIDKVIMYHNTDFEAVGQIPITLLKTETREPNEVIGIQKSKCENWVAIISGKNLVMNEQKQNQLFVFKREQAKSDEGYDQFILHKRVVVKDMDIFERVAMEYHFKTNPGGGDPDTIIFAKPDQIFELNYMTETHKTIQKFTVPLLAQPSFFQLNTDQNCFVIASKEDGIYVDLNKGKEQVDLDELYNIRDIKAIIYDIEDCEFYLLCNVMNGVIGFYILKFDVSDPKQKTDITMWRHNLDIDNANVYISRSKQGESQYKELVVGYKTIGINTYNTVVLDLSADTESGRQTLQRHEAFQLWESPVSGLLLEISKDYLTFSRAGINVLALGSQEKKPLKDCDNMDKVMHSLDSVSYLKTDAINFINFKCQDYNNRVMSIEQEWTNTEEDGLVSTNYDEIYKIKIHEVTLRELLILQSFYVSKTTSDIINLIKLQPDPRFFYKTFLELGGTNFCSILSFDSMSMDSLLSEENEQYFSEEYPIIYKNKMEKKDGSGYFYTNAIDNALKNNQVKAVNLLLKYIVTYQNNFVSSYLFTKNIPVLMEKGISLHDLLASDVFSVVFDYDQWPGNHNDDEECVRAYNGSYFDIRHSYDIVFPDIAPMDDQPAKGEKADNSKVYKIKYTINLLAQIDMYIEQDDEGRNQFINEEVSLMTLCGETEELEIFDTVALQNVIEFKWNQYGRNHHFLGCMMHLFYTIILIIYVKSSYLVESENSTLYSILLAVGIIYPAIYDFIQMAKGDLCAYFSDVANYFDLLYIYGSILNIVLQITLGPFHIISKILMCLIVLLLINKTFFFLRIFPMLTPIVVMITNVIYDLRIFLLFYLILIALFCQIFAVLGLGNEYLALEEGQERGYLNPSGPAVEYQAVGLHFGEFFWTFRLSLGDFSAVGAWGAMKKVDMQIFWVMWILTVIITCVIFLNFVVAEACASYSRVVESLEAVIAQAQTVLIAESEDMTMQRNKHKEKFPKYLITRSLES